MSNHEKLFVLTITEMKHSSLLERLLCQFYSNNGDSGCLVGLLTQTCVCSTNRAQNLVSMYTFKSFIYILCKKIMQQFRWGNKTYIVVIISVSYNFNNLQWYICIKINEICKWQKRVWTNYWQRVKYCPQYNWSRWLGITNCSL